MDVGRNRDMLRFLAVALLMTALLVAACDGGGDGDDEATPTPASSPTADEGGSPEPDQSPDASSPEPGATPTAGDPGDDGDPGPQVTERAGAPALEVDTVSSPITPGEQATVAVTTAPDEKCAVSVVRGNFQGSDYVGTAPPYEVMLQEGMEAKTSGADGAVSWSWQLPADTTPDTWKVTVFCGLTSGVASTAVADLVVEED
jgi:hypothetical protein